MKNSKRLKLTRIYLDLTLEDIADRMFVTKQTISNIERESKSSKTAELLYGLTLESILKERGVKLIIED